MKFNKTFETKHALTEFCNKYVLNIIPELQKENIRKSGNVNSKEHDEIVTFISFIYYSMNKPFWNYPVTMIYDDRPDFIVQYDDEKISLEVTRQISENYSKALVLYGDKKSNMDLCFFKYDVENNQKYSNDYLNKIVCDKIYSPPSMGSDDFPINWLNRTIDTIRQKNQKLEKYPKITTYSKHILLIFNLAPEPTDTLVNKHFLETNFYQQCSKTLFERVVCIDGSIIDIDIKNKCFEYCKNKAIPIIQKIKDEYLQKT